MKRLRNLSLGVKLPAMFAALAILAAATTGVVAMLTVRVKLEQAAHDAVLAARDGRLMALESWRDETAGRLESGRVAPAIREALAALSAPPRPAATDPLAHAGEPPRALDYAVTDFLAALGDRDGFRDILLVDPAGTVVYSAAGSPAAGRSLRTGPWSESNLGKAVAAAAEKGEVVFSDLARMPDSDRINAFAAASVEDRNGRPAGVLVAEIDPARIDAIMQEARGIGATGEAFLVGPDNLLRSNVPSEDEAALVDGSDTDGVLAALDGESGIERIDDSSGVVMLSAYTPFRIGDATWALMTQQDLTESEAAFNHLLEQLLLVTLVTSAVIIALGFAFSRGITRPLRRLSDSILAVAEGDYASEIAATDHGDEIGAMARSVVVLRDGLEARQARIADQEAIITAIGRSQAMIEFDPQGRILRANPNMLATVGYDESAVVGHHHAMLAEPEFAESAEYRRMWEGLRNGEPLAGTFRRVGKGGRTVYLQGAYSPVCDEKGAVVRVVKVVSDITRAETERREGIERRNAMEAEQARVVAELGSALARLAGGDLAFRIDAAFSADYEALRGNFNDAITRLEGALGAVMVAAESIRNEATHVTRAADDLSHRTESQAAALEETAASLEELTASVRAAAKSAEQANNDVEATRRNAEESGRIVRDAIGAMSEIEKSSDHISQIIGVIDDIAFQTNLLALNAGVEAARAGEAGRGFAVVASEVRALAQRSSDAAKEIKGLISTSSQHVGRGVDLVRETGRSLETIVAAVGGITGLVAEIAHSSREQAVGLSEINSAVGQLDQVTQQNAAMVEESTAASHAMKGEAEALGRLIGQFKAGLPEGQPAPAPRTAAARRPAATLAIPAARETTPAQAAALRRAAGKGAVNGHGSADDWQEF